MKKDYFTERQGKPGVFAGKGNPYWISWILVMAMLNLTACFQSFFKVTKPVAPAGESVSQLVSMQKNIIVHIENAKFNLTQIRLDDKNLTGTLTSYHQPPTINPVKPQRPNRYYTRASLNQRYLLNEVHVYMNEFSKTQSDQITIPFSAISRIDVYDKETAATIGSYFISTLGIVAGAYLTAGLIVLLFKESCPFIYIRDGQEYRFAGEIYSGSIHKPLERDDYLKLPDYEGGQEYTLKITNEAREVQHTNLMELMVIDHRRGTTILVDKKGEVSALTALLPPARATGLAGTDATEKLAEKGGGYYQTVPDGSGLPETDGVILEFPDPGKSTSARLAIRAKNSIMADYMMGQFHDLFGNRLGLFMKKQRQAPAERQRQWALNQGLPLSLYVERENGWEFVDYFNIAGPMAFKEDILDIPLKGNETKPLKVKLEFGAWLWEIDYAAICYEPEKPVAIRRIQPESAVTEKKNEVKKMLAMDDERYYTQPDNASEAVVTFRLPEASGNERTLCLHTKGWYEIIRNPEGKPDMDYIYTLRQPGAFNRFINRELIKLKESIAP